LAARILKPVALRKKASFHLPQRVEHELPVAGLDPRHDGVRIAHITDLHCGVMTPQSHILHAIELIHDAQPHAVVMTGDYVSYNKSEIRVMERLLGQIKAPHVFATLGNHDYYASGREVKKALGRCGHTVLSNEHKVVDIEGAPLTFIGIDDPVTRKDNLHAAFDGAPKTGTRVVLCHCPESVDRIAEQGAHLMVSGHTHGGQINVKGFTKRFFQSVGKRYFFAGLYNVAGTHLYVNPGIGFSGVPLRVGEGTRAEVTLFRLRSMS
jgi:predicted MPP superfamily phosphohydrolase